MDDSDIEEPEKKKIRMSDHFDLKRRSNFSTDEAVESIKKLCVSAEADVSTNDRINEGEAHIREQALAAQRRKNFLVACERVSYEHFCDHRRRFLFLFPPSCAVGKCLHKPANDTPSELANYAKEGFLIDFKSHMWCDALLIAQMALRPDTYLSYEVLQHILEIILNAHHDDYSGFTVPYLLNRCELILDLIYRTHPPCVSGIRKCYKNFLTSAMPLKNETLSDRSKFGCEKGVLKYCLNRLEYEIKTGCTGPLVNRNDHITEEMEITMKGLQWQKEKLDIFETMDRSDRIKRLIIVLKNLVELLTMDLSIWLSRHTSKQSKYIMGSQRPLLAFILWPENILYTGGVNNNCRQIMSLFVKFVQYEFPENDVQVILKLLNAMIQTFYICEANSSSDYPHTGKYCIKFAQELYKKVKELPIKTIIEVLKQIQPTFMRHLVGVMFAKDMLHSRDDDILTIMQDFLRNENWKDFSAHMSDETKGQKSKITTAKKVHRIYKNFSRVAKAAVQNIPMDVSDGLHREMYPKCETDYRVDYITDTDNVISQEEITQVVLVTLDACLDTYSIEKLQETLYQLNHQLLGERVSIDENQQRLPYALSEQFYKLYRSIYQNLNEIKIQLRMLRQSPDFKLFKNFDTLLLGG